MARIRPNCLIDAAPRVTGRDAWNPPMPMTSWQRERRDGRVAGIQLPLLPRIVRRIERAVRGAGQ